MLDLEEEFLDSYIELEKLCKDMYHVSNGLSTYIDRMDKNMYEGRVNIPSWNKDYKNLKRVRHIRNSLMHEGDCLDLDEDDIEFVQEFYDLIIFRQDPLYLLKHRPVSKQEVYLSNNKDKKSNGKLFLIIFMFIIMLGIMMMITILNLL